MDIVFAVATSEVDVYVEDENLTLLLGQKKINIPILHDRIQSLEDLKKLRETLHKRIDAIFDKSQETYEKKNGAKAKKKYKVFNCFGSEPELIEIEI